MRDLIARIKGWSAQRQTQARSKRFHHQVDLILAQQHHRDAERCREITRRVAELRP